MPLFVHDFHESCSAKRDAKIEIPLAIIQMASALFMLLFTFKYVYMKRRVENKRLFYLGLTVFVIQMTLQSLDAYVSIMFSPSNSARLNGYTLAGIFDILYLFQFSLLIFLPYYRIKCIFDNTHYQLSKRTKFSFAMLFLMFLFLPIYAFYWFSYIIACVILGSILISMLTCLFVKKIKSIREHALSTTDNSEKWIKIITKSMLLAWISILTFAIFVIVHLILESYMSSTDFILFGSCAVFGPDGLELDEDEVVNVYHLVAVYRFVITMNLNADFLSIIFSFSMFSGYYHKCCGVCHQCCRQWTIATIDSNKNSDVKAELSMTERSTIEEQQ